MISDTLSDAIKEIERYQRECEPGYSSLRAELDMVKTVMDAMRTHLDSVEGSPEESASLAFLRACITKAEGDWPMGESKL